MKLTQNQFQGDLASMPVTFYPGTTYFATDTDTLYGYDNESLPIELCKPSIDSSYVAKTKAEITNMISSKTLKAGTLYKITGTHKDLYNDGTNAGTDIYLHALSTGVLAPSGFGEFWNPKYDKNVSGYGIWTNASTFISGTVTGVFNADEAITANNGATGTLVSLFDNKRFVALTGDWNLATSMTGNSSGATSVVNSVTLKTYEIGSKVIWGGYSWTSINGTVGSRSDILELNSGSWKKDPYTEANYNKVLDVIEYDIVNDYITTRSELRGGNTVKFIYGDSDRLPGSYSGISVFMFGNPYDSGFGKGVLACSVINSYFECVDFRGKSIEGVSLTDYSSIWANRLYSNCSIVSMSLRGVSSMRNCALSESLIGFDLEASKYDANHVFGSYQQYNKLYNATMEGNHVVSSYMNNNDLSQVSSISYNKLYKGSSVSLNKLDNYGRIQNNTLTDNSSVDTNTVNTYGIINYNVLKAYGLITSNLMFGGTVSYNTLNTNSEISYCESTRSHIFTNTLENNSSISNTILIQESKLETNRLNSSSIWECRFEKGSLITGVTNIISGKSMRNVVVESATIVSSLAAATVIFSDVGRKTVYRRSDLTVRIRHVNASDAFVSFSVTA